MPNAPLSSSPVRGRGHLPAFCLAALLALAGCASSPKSSGKYYQDDGPPLEVPPGLELTPDAEPRIEPLARGPNRPYTVLGRQYVPQTADEPYPQRGLASWYGRKYHGRPTSSGETYDMFGMSAAHPTLPIPSYVRVRHVASGREVVLKVNDRGPFSGDRIIDVSYTAALKLGLLSRGSTEVEIERLTHEVIRSGEWRLGGNGAAALTDLVGR